MRCLVEDMDVDLNGPPRTAHSEAGVLLSELQETVLFSAEEWPG